MVDNVTITEGAGTTVATDDISTVHYQRVKAVLGADGTAVDPAADVGVSGTDVQRVTLASDQAVVIKVAPTVTAGAYTANDCIGGEQTLSNAARVSGQGGVLSGIMCAIEDDAANGWRANDIEVIIFDSNPAGTYTDNTALAVTDADSILIMGSILLDTHVDCGNVSLLYAQNIGLIYECNGSANLYAVAVNRGGRIPDATDGMHFTYQFVRD